MALSVVLAPLPALADEQDTFNVRWSESLTRDNNLFRLPDGVDPSMVGLNSSSRGDTIRTDTLGLTADKAYSLQRFHLGARLDRNHYSRYDYLDNTTRNADARWNWALTPHVTGLVSADRVQAINNFADYQAYVRSIRTTDTYRGEGEFGTGGALRLVAGAAQSKTSNSERFQQDWDSRTRSAYGGLRYLAGSSSQLGYTYRHNQVDWIGRNLDAVALYDTEARQADHEIYGRWDLSAQGSIDGAIIRLHRTHQNFAERDYSGTAGRLNFNWAPEEQFRIQLFARRDYASWWSGTASYSVTDNYGLAPVWLVTPKVSLSGRIERSQREFRGPVVPTSAPSREDRIDSAQIGLNWMPMRMLTISGMVQKSRRSSNQPGLDYSDTLTAISAQLTL
jgi:exopolysaccharide biosynthesis operon protein EpsL